ncbi:MAG TPA: MFS transporter [Candidatus Limnocylindrales bacterium]
MSASSRPPDTTNSSESAPLRDPSADAAADAEGPRAWQLGRRLAGLTPSGRARVPLSWAFYDFGDTIYSAAIISTAMGLWLTDPSRLGNDAGQLVFSIAIALSVGLNALVSPILGALSDRAGRRMPFLLFFTVVTIVFESIIGPTPALVGALLFVIANFGYQASLIYFDATLAVVSLPRTRGAVSGLGVGIGYMGTIFMAVLLIILGTEHPEPIFPIAGLLFAIFATPVFLFVREPRPAVSRRLTAADVVSAFGQFGAVVEHARSIPHLGRFLLGRFFYTDALNTVVVVMSVLAVRAMGLTQTQWLMLLLVVTIVAIVMSFAWGRIVDRVGPKRTLMAVLVDWLVGLTIGIVAVGMPGTTLGLALFILAGALVGTGMGGIHVSDRVFMIRLSPRERLGEFFGLYGLVGKGSQVVGQLLYGVVVFVFYERLGNGAYQLAVLSLIGAMLVGAWLIWPVSDHWRGRAAERLAGEDDVGTVPLPFDQPAIAES